MIPDNEKLYQAVFKHKPIEGFVVTESGDIYNTKTGNKMAKHPKTGNNYQSVSLYVNNDKKVVSVHQLIYESITGICPTDIHMEIDHINGIKTDNSISNLQLLTHDENVKKARADKSHMNFHRNISDDIAKDICELLSQGLTPSEIVNKRGYSYKWVYGILNRDYCVDISKDYVWHQSVKAGVSIPDSVIHGICEDLVAGKGIRETARKWNVGHTTVASIRDGKTRIDISSQYDMSGLSDAEKLSLQTGEHVVPYVTKKGKSTNVLVTNLGRFFREGSLTELSPSMQHGDPSVSIRIDNGKERHIPCKKLVAEMFCDNPKGYKDIVYKDGNVYNLKSTNLKFVSHSKACKASGGYELRRSYDGSENPNAKISEDHAEAILIMRYEMQMSCKAIARCFNLTKAAIEKICNGEVRGKLYNKYMRTHLNMQKNYLGSDNLVIKL